MAEAELTRFIKADLQADRFSWELDNRAIAQAQLFDGKLVLLTNAPDLTPAETIARYKSLADIDIFPLNYPCNGNGFVSDAILKSGAGLPCFADPGVSRHFRMASNVSLAA